jgi:hypothetical protein
MKIAIIAKHESKGCTAFVSINTCRIGKKGLENL